MSRMTIGLFAIALPFSAAAQMESYTIDPFHTVPYFDVDHLGFATMRGRFDSATGKFAIDRAARTGTLEVFIQTDTLSTGDSHRAGRPRTRDEHLRTPDFFNVAEYPTMTYKSTSVKFNGDYPGTIEGNLTLLGVTKPLLLRVENWICKPHPFSKKEMCGGNASGSFKRSDFGMKYAVPAVGDEIKLWIQIEGYKN